MQWKEENEITIDDLYHIHNIICELIEKINKENKHLSHFKFEYKYNKRESIDKIIKNNYIFNFINVIFTISLPNKTKIDHNKLTDIFKYF